MYPEVWAQHFQLPKNDFCMLKEKIPRVVMPLNVSWDPMNMEKLLIYMNSLCRGTQQLQLLSFQSTMWSRLTTYKVHMQILRGS